MPSRFSPQRRLYVSHASGGFVRAASLGDDSDIYRCNANFDSHLLGSPAAWADFVQGLEQAYPLLRWVCSNVQHGGLLLFDYISGRQNLLVAEN